jgi:very-short-patch-repair endonuclease
MPHTQVSPKQRGRANELRGTMTRSETLLWRYLKAHRLKGLSFRRQAPMGAYIVDFVCHDARLVVEVDGASHDFESRQQRDRIRDAWLKTRGFEVLRLTDSDVLGNLEGVLGLIHEIAGPRLCNQTAESANTLLPNPPPQGGREHAAASLESPPQGGREHAAAPAREGAKT